MIIGLQLVRGLDVKTTSGKGYGLDAGVGATIPAAVSLPMGLTAEAGKVGQSSEVMEFKFDEEVVFAYQLLILKLKRKGKVCNKGIFTESTKFSASTSVGQNLSGGSSSNSSFAIIQHKDDVEDEYFEAAEFGVQDIRDSQD